MRRCSLALFALLVGVGLWSGPATAPAHADDTCIGRFFYYPYYYFPHSYWPTQGCKWPERPGMPYMRPPAYMQYPAFKEPDWHYDVWEPKRHYRGFHFWLDQF
jgi:hypothetical protein